MQACFWPQAVGSSSVDPVNWEEFVRCQVRANETYLEAKRQFSLVTFLGMPSPLLSVWCSARVRHCLRLLAGVVAWCESLFVKVIPHDQWTLTTSNMGTPAFGDQLKKIYRSIQLMKNSLRKMW